MALFLEPSPLRHDFFLPPALRSSFAGAPQMILRVSSECCHADPGIPHASREPSGPPIISPRFSILWPSDHPRVFLFLVVPFCPLFFFAPSGPLLSFSPFLHSFRLRSESSPSTLRDLWFATPRQRGRSLLSRFHVLRPRGFFRCLFFGRSLSLPFSRRFPFALRLRSILIVRLNRPCSLNASS